jgi:hypothetical protein
MLAALLLLRHEQRLLLAVPYGAFLLLLSEVAERSLELGRVARVQAEAVSARLAASALLAALGAGAAAIVAGAVTIGPARSVAITGAGALAAIATFAVLVRLARRHPDGSAGSDEQPQ